MIYILDTNVISEMVRLKPDQKVLNWVANLGENQAYLSVITVGELNKGIQRLRGENSRKERLARWLDKELIPRFRNRILPLDLSIMLEWGKLAAALERAGTPMPAIDSLIAATVINTGFILATRNESDFVNADIETFNPWAN